MSQSDRAIKKLATQLARLDREVKSWRGAQADFTSIENGGNFTFKDGDGNVTAIMGGQDDGSNTIRHVDGPTPPVPSGLSAHVDGPIVQVSWDGTFESDVTHDWHYLEVLAVGPNNEQLTGTINDLNGGETSLAATAQGDWVITARSVSRAGKRSLDGDAGTVAVQLVGLTGAIDAVQESANGKNTIYYSPTEPVAPEGGFNNGDLWFDTSEEGNNTASVWDGNGWVSMEDARLATIIAAQEALESDLQDVQTSVDGKNTITYDPALPPASYVGAVGDTWYRTSGNSMIGFWKWDGASWVQQELSTTVIPQIDIGAGTFGNLSGARLQVGTVYADSIVSGLSQNMVPDPGFANPEINAARLSYANQYGSVMSISNGVLSVDMTGTVTVNPNIAMAATSDLYAWAAYPAMSVVSKVSARVTDGAGQVRMTLRFRRRDGSTSHVTMSPLQHTVGAEWADYSSSYALPQDAVGYSIVLQVQATSTGVVEFRSPFAASSIGGTLIENGAITTDKLAAGSITAESGIIESLDLGTATVGELDGIRIMGQTVRGEQLSGDAIDGKVITGGTYRTSGGNGSWSDDGLFIAQPDGTSMVRFPTDGSPLSLTASDVQIDRASVTDLDLSFGAVRSGGQFTLASGVTAPASPPELTTGWQKVCTLPAPEERHDIGGFGYWGEGAGHWVRAVNVLGTGEGDRVELYDATTGEFERSFQIDCDPRNGLTVMGDIVYVFGGDHGAGNAPVIDGYNLVTGVRTSRHSYTRSIQAQNALGNDGTNLIVASVYNRRLWVHYRNPVTGVQVGSDMLSGENTWPPPEASNLYGVSVNGSGEITVVATVASRVYIPDGGDLIRKLDSANASGFAGWENPNKNGSGMVFVGGVPYVVVSGALYKGSTSASDYTSELCFTWYDGTHETTASPVAVVDVAARETVTVSLPVRAGLQKRLYSRTQGGTNWARSTVAADTTVAPVPVGLLLYAPPTTNTFPNADPAVFRSTNGNVVVRGDGSGKWGPLTFNADGTMTSTQIPAWVPVTTFKTGFGPQTWGYAPAYRIWPDGKVEWRGIVAGTIGAGQTPLFTIPAAAMPAQYCQFGSAATYNSTYGSTARVEFRSAANPNDASAYDGAATRSWVSLDGIYYYLT